MFQITYNYSISVLGMMLSALKGKGNGKALHDREPIEKWSDKRLLMWVTPTCSSSMPFRKLPSKSGAWSQGKMQVAEVDVRHI